VFTDFIQCDTSIRAICEIFWPCMVSVQHRLVKVSVLATKW